MEKLTDYVVYSETTNEIVVIKARPKIKVNKQGTKATIVLERKNGSTTDLNIPVMIIGEL
jgi:hypothetical protein